MKPEKYELDISMQNRAAVDIPLFPSLSIRVARWFVFRPKIKIRGNF
jgi:hypothetical protein